VVLSGYSGFSTTKTGRHDIAEILLKVALKHQKSNQIKSLGKDVKVQINVKTAIECGGEFRFYNRIPYSCNH